MTKLCVTVSKCHACHACHVCHAECRVRDKVVCDKDGVRHKVVCDKVVCERLCDKVTKLCV